MRYRKLGNTGLSVSEIGMGCEGFAEQDCAMTKILFDLAEKEGVNFFDLYSPDPAVRSAIGEAMQGRRDKFIIQAHLCSVWENGQYMRTRRIEKVKDNFERAFKELQTDYIDIGMIHYVDAISDWERLVKCGVLSYAEELKAAGRIGHIGLSSHNPEVALAAIKTGKIEVLMFSVNPCYDLQPASEDVNDLWADEAYSSELTNMDPERQALYEACDAMGVGIDVMKAFGGGDLLDASLSPAGAALTVDQCIHYALTRPAVASVFAGAHSEEELARSIAYENASEEEKDYASALSSFPRISWKGHCMYCNHCLPCPQEIDIASVTKYYHLARGKQEIPETVREHYKSLTAHAGDCISCGACETRCPFEVNVRENMKQASALFGY